MGVSCVHEWFVPVFGRHRNPHKVRKIWCNCPRDEGCWNKWIPQQREYRCWMCKCGWQVSSLMKMMTEWSRKLTVLRPGGQSKLILFGNARNIHYRAGAQALIARSPVRCNRIHRGLDIVVTTISTASIRARDLIPLVVSSSAKSEAWIPETW